MCCCAVKNYTYSLFLVRDSANRPTLCALAADAADVYSNDDRQVG